MCVDKGYSLGTNSSIWMLTIFSLRFADLQANGVFPWLCCLTMPKRSEPHPSSERSYSFSCKYQRDMEFYRGESPMMWWVLGMPETNRKVKPKENYWKKFIEFRRTEHSTHGDCIGRQFETFYLCVWCEWSDLHVIAFTFNIWKTYYEHSKQKPLWSYQHKWYLQDERSITNIWTSLQVEARLPVESTRKSCFKVKGRKRMWDRKRWCGSSQKRF